MLLLTLISQAGFILACLYLGYQLPYDPTAGLNAPKYLLSNIDPTIILFFQWACLLLVFDGAHRHERDRIVEVMDATQLTNLETLTGRALAVAGVIWVVAVLNVSFMQFVGSISFFGWDYAETLQWHSVVNLILIDGPVNLIFWTSLLVLLTVVLRSRLVVLLLGGSLMFGWYWMVIRSPYPWLSVVSPYSNDTILISEIVPSFISFHAFLVRISYILFATFFLVCAASLQNRIDGTKSRWLNRGLLPTSLAIGLGIFLLGAWGLIAPFNQFDRWKTVHAEYEWTDDIDIQHIGGSVRINPRDVLDTQFIITCVRKSGSATQPLVFTLNSGLTVHDVEIEGTPTAFDFENGLLEIQSPNVEVNTPFELLVSARGKPRANFAYLDSVVNYLTEPVNSTHLAKLFGKDGSIYHSSYVALMPGAHWYPTPGPVNNRDIDSPRVRDFFTVDLTVSLTPANWSLVASPATTKLPDEPRSYSVQSIYPVSEVGLFASRFERATMEVGEIEFTMNLHAKHSNNLIPLDSWDDTIRALAESWIAEYQYVGLPILNRTINLVEVPRSLRSIESGWRMDNANALPGLILLKEHGYPRARRQLAVDRYINSLGLEIDDTSEVLAPLMLLNFYFQRGLGTDAPWSSLNEHLWTHHTAPVGEYAPMLDQIVNWLIVSLPPDLNRQFSIYSSMHVADFTRLQLINASEGLDDAISVGGDLVRDWYAPSTVRIERNYIDRHSIWNYLEHTEKSYSASTLKAQKDFEALMLKSREIASELLSANDQERVYKWIHALRTQHRGAHFTYANFIESAQLHELEYEPFITDWITSRSLPALSVHDVSIRQISNDERGESRFQTSFVLHNNHPVMGYVRINAPSERPVGRTPFLTYSTVDSFSIDGNSELRVNFITEYSIDYFYLEPGLSLNRDVLYLNIDKRSHTLQSNLQPSPITESINSFKPDHSIIVDDLDPEFKINQKLPDLRTTPRFGPLAWFSYRHGQIELDSGLPIDHPNINSRKFLNVWLRTYPSLLIKPVGRYRQTSAAVTTKTGVLPEVAFTTQLTRDDDWQLDYHNPWVYGDSLGSWRWPEDDTLFLEIEQGDTSFEEPLQAHSMSYGWNKIGTFNLHATAVKVKLMYRPKRNAAQVTIYADAIRWTPTDDH